MFRALISSLVLLLMSCAPIAAQVPGFSEWFEPPPEDFAIEKQAIKKLLGEDYREHPNWISLDEWLKQLSVPRIRDRDLLLYYYKCWYELWLNTQLPQQYWTAPIICPSTTTYSRGIWLWDTGFQVMGLVSGKEKAIELAKNQIRVMVENQHSDGRIPREVWADGPRFFGMGVQAPGILSLAALEIYRVTGDWFFIEEIYDRLRKNHEWFERNTDPDRDGLYTWSGADSGWDSSPRWDQKVSGAVDLSCWMYLDRVLLAEMSSILGKEGMATAYHSRAKQTAQRIQRWMWDATDGLFYDVGPGPRAIRIKTPASFFPMFVGIASKEQASRMVEALTDPKTFWTRYPVPCAAQDVPGFNPNKYWKGNVWVNLNWIVIQGLRRYDYHRLADELSGRTLDLIMQHPVSQEYYNPLTGEGLGAKYYGWTAALFIRLCNELIDRRSAGVLEVTVNQSSSTILPPEDFILSVELRNVSSKPVTDLRVRMESEFSAGKSEQTYDRLEPDTPKAFVFRVAVPEDRRGHTYFHIRVTGKQEQRPIVVERGHTLIMRDPYDSILYLLEGRRIGSKPFRVLAVARNFRVQPLGGGILTLEVPAEWKVIPNRKQEVRFPWSNVRDEKTLTITPPGDLPAGTYIIGSTVSYPLSRPNRTVRGGTVAVYRPPRWAVIGSFDNSDGKGLLTVFPPEKGIDLAAQYPGKRGVVGWRMIPEDKLDENGYVDLRGVFRDEKLTVAYAATAVYSATDIAAEVRVGSDDGVAVWVNGERVIFDSQIRSAEPDQNSAAVQLRSGWNPVLIKVSQYERDWGFYFRITNQEGQPIPGVYGNPDALPSTEGREAGQ